MDVFPFIKSVLEQDCAPIVLCDLEHTILYMNKAAIERYRKQGGADLLGKSLLFCHNAESRSWIEKVIAWFAEDSTHNIVYTYHNAHENKDVYMVALRDDDDNLIGYYEKHSYRDRETAELYNLS